MQRSIWLKRVAVIDRGEGGRRVLRAVRELVREGRAEAAVAIHGPRDARTPFVREADEAVSVEASFALALHAARADAAWLGAATLAERATFAEACDDLGVLHVGPPAAALRKVSTKEGLASVAHAAGVSLAPATPAAGARLIEVVLASAPGGAARVVGVGDASLSDGAVALLAESPPAALPAGVAAALHEAALRAWSAAGFAGVGAVSFLVDPSGPPTLVGIDVTARSGAAVEAANDVDLVRLAFGIVMGAGAGDGTRPARSAAAARVLAGDPQRRAPGSGRVERVRLPCDPAVRAGASVEEGDEVAAGEVIATVVAHGTDREAARSRLAQALGEVELLVRGIGSSRAWLRALLDRPEVKTGGAGCGLLAALAREPIVQQSPEVAVVAAAIEAYDEEQDLERGRFLAEARRGRPKVGPSSGRVVELRYAGLRYRVDVRQIGPGTYRVAAGGAAAEVTVERLGAAERRLKLGDRRARVLVAVDGPRQLVEVDGVPHEIFIEPEGVVASPMPAVVVSVPVTQGQRVEKGDPIARLESMKVELAVPAPMSGIIREVVAVANTQVNAGSPLVRIQPEEAGPAPAAAAPLALGAPAPAPASVRERYLAALDELLRLALGFDLAPAEARKLAATLRELGAEVYAGDPVALRAEEAVLGAFGDLRALFSRTRPLDAPEGTKPPLEELWRYLHEPQARGEGLTAAFLDSLRRALAHYAVSLDAPGRALELALLRIQKAHERVNDAAPAVLALLDRRLAAGSPPPGLDGPGARGLLDRLAQAGEEGFPAIGDLARELRYRRFDETELAQARAAAYAQAEADLVRLSAAGSERDRDAAIAGLVACPQPIATLLLSRMASAPALRPRLVEALVRRYYRVRTLLSVQAREVDGVACAKAEYVLEGKPIQLLAVFATAAELDKAARVAARLAGDVPADPDLSVEFYVWNEGALDPDEALLPRLAGSLAAANFPRPLRRASLVIAMGQRGYGNQASQRHLTFRGGPAVFEEDKRWSGLHPMIFRRMQLSRLEKFDLERLPAGEDVYLYRGVARANPKDERLFGVVEVRDLTPVRDAAGRIVRLPGFEQKFHEVLAGMRRFQARRATHQRVEWNRVLLTVEPPLTLTRDELRELAARVVPATEGLGLEMVAVAARMPGPDGTLQETLIRVTSAGGSIGLRFDEPTDRPLEPMAEYQQKVIALRRRGLTHPFELVKMLAPPADSDIGVPPGEFVEHDLGEDGATLVPVKRGPGLQKANIVVGLARTFNDRYPEGMLRVCLLSDPSRMMGSLAEPECRIILGALALADKLGVPLEWFAVSAGALISMKSGTENMDWISLVLRRIIEFTQKGGEINIVICGITVGGQPYWNAEATMLMHCRGILVMTTGSSMVLTGKDALEFSGSVSAEDNLGIGGYDRIMGVNGQAQYFAESLAEGIQILIRHYEHTYVAPGEVFPRRAKTTDPADRDIRTFPHGPGGGAGFVTVGDVFSMEKNPDRKKPFEIRRIMAAVADQDHATMERWRDVRGGDTAVVWDAHVGGWPVCLLGIESRPIPRLEFVPADGSTVWSAGTLFPQSSKKLARAINCASGKVPVVVLANLSGFDGSPESMRRLQLEYGAEIGRAVVNFKGPFVFCVVSRYHGGAFVVFSKTLREDIEVVAVEGARASVIGGAPAAAVVFAREVDTRTKKDPRVVEAEQAAQAGGAAKARLAELYSRVRSEMVGVVADEFDKVHSVERALKVGSLDRIIAPRDVRPYVVDAVERGIRKYVK